MERIGNRLADLNLKPEENDAIIQTATTVWNLYGNAVPPGAYNALDQRVKNAYEELKTAQDATKPTAPGMFRHNIEIQRRPRT